MSYKIALDLGTSGERAQALDERGKIISTAITLRHPLPGANIMDHLHFTIENGTELSRSLIIHTVNKLFRALRIDLDKVDSTAVCGNPCQLSLFEGIEIRDLAYAGKNLLEKLKVKIPERNAKVLAAEELNLSINHNAEVIIPPSVRHEIGADALAMIMKSGIMNEEGFSLVTDYGTNAEMGLHMDGEVYTASAAAGPAIEGQHIEFGMLASPGAISDLDENWRNYVLDEKLKRQKGDAVDPNSGRILERGGIRSKGITGTGVVAAIAMGMEKGLISAPRILTRDRRLHLQDRIYLLEKDLTEASKAISAISAGHKTLMEEADIDIRDLNSVYMAGALGTYVDPLKAQRVGLIPPQLNKVVQIGNTSLAMAVDLVRAREVLDEMQEFSNSLRSKHIMLANSETFVNTFICELGLRVEGMPFEKYNQLLQRFGLQQVPLIKKPREIIRAVKRDIPVLGKKGLKIVTNIGLKLVGIFEECTACGACAKECPEGALTVKKGSQNRVVILSELCNGTACKRCEWACPRKTFRFEDLMMEEL